MALAEIISFGIVVLIAIFGPIIIKKLNGIHELTNSNLTALNTKLDVANKEIAGLTALIAEMRNPSGTKGTVT